jgi:hypothetical protein
VIHVDFHQQPFFGFQFTEYLVCEIGENVYLGVGLRGRCFLKGLDHFVGSVRDKKNCAKTKEKKKQRKYLPGLGYC